MNVLSFTVLASAVILLVVWSAGIVPAAVCVAAVLTCGLAAILTRREHTQAPPVAGGPSFPWVEALGLALLAFLAVTLMPLPPLLDSIVGATRQAQNETVRQALRDLAACGYNVDLSPWFALSRNRAGTGRVLLLLAAAFGAGALAARLPRGGRLAWLGLLAALGAAVGIAGHLGQWWYPQGDTLWWLFPIPHVLPGPVGGFINRNHFAGFVAILVPPALGLAAWAWMARRRLIALAAALAALAMVFALLMSLSRGAVLALACGLAGTVLLALLRRRPWAGLLALGGGILLAAAVLFFPHHAVQDRFRSLRNPGQDLSVHTRLDQWRESLRAWTHYPVIGAGANALRMVYPQYRLTAEGKWLVHAENVPVQILAEGGLVGAALAVWLALALARRTRSGPTVLPAACRLGIGGALLTGAAHGLWDFALLVPAYAVVLATLMGLLLPPPVPDRGLRQALRLAPVLAGLLAAGWLAAAGLADLRRLDDHAALPSAPIPDLERALVQAPSSWHAWYYLGIAVARDGVVTPDLRRCILGERLASQAARCDPQNYRLWDWLGQLRRALRDDEGAAAAFARAKALRPWYVPRPAPLEPPP